MTQNKFTDKLTSQGQKLPLYYSTPGIGIVLLTDSELLLGKLIQKPAYRPTSLVVLLILTLHRLRQSMSDVNVKYSS